MSGKKYPFIVSNTNRSDKNGTQWWSVLNISPKSELFVFYYFAIDGMRHFIVQDDKQTVVKVLKGIELANRKDDKITLIKWKFSMN